jgi:hypothetical protein
VCVAPDGNNKTENLFKLGREEGRGVGENPKRSSGAPTQRSRQNKKMFLKKKKIAQASHALRSVATNYFEDVLYGEYFGLSSIS